MARVHVLHQNIKTAAQKPYGPCCNYPIYLYVPHGVWGGLM